MTADPVAARFAAARAIALSAGETALGFFARRDRLTIESKGAAQDLVSEADRTVEDGIRAALAAAFPEDGLIGEERGAQAGTSGYVWLIDPIDGTQPFLDGQPNWCVSIAVRGPDRILAGVVHAPALGETYTARRGAGAFLGERRLVVDPGMGLTSSVIAFGANTRTDPDEAGRFIAALYRRGGVMFRVGSGALMLAYVAAGRAAGYFDPSINAWDCYAGNLIVEEAGGRVAFEGSESEPGRLYAAAPAAFDPLVGLVVD